jgi:hypothetical protein
MLDKPFQLRRAVGNDARIHREGEWQLRFRDSNAHKFAEERLYHNDWISHKDAPDDEIIFTFQHLEKQPGPLANLIARGIPKEQIEVLELNPARAGK